MRTAGRATRTAPRRRFVVTLPPRAARGLAVVFAHVQRELPGVFASLDEFVAWALICNIPGSLIATNLVKAYPALGDAQRTPRAVYANIFRIAVDGAARPYASLSDVRAEINGTKLAMPSPVRAVTAAPSPTRRDPR